MNSWVRGAQGFFTVHQAQGLAFGFTLGTDIDVGDDQHRLVVDVQTAALGDDQVVQFLATQAKVLLLFKNLPPRQHFLIFTQGDFNLCRITDEIGDALADDLFAREAGLLQEAGIDLQVMAVAVAHADRQRDGIDQALDEFLGCAGASRFRGSGSVAGRARQRARG